MNPLFLLLGFIGANWAFDFGSSDDSTSRSLSSDTTGAEDDATTEAGKLDNNGKAVGRRNDPAPEEPEVTDPTPEEPTVITDPIPVADPAPEDDPSSEEPTDVTDPTPVEDPAPAPDDGTGDDAPTGTTDPTGSDDGNTGSDFTDVTTPTAPTQSSDSTNGAETQSLVASGSVDVVAGRVATLKPPADDIVGLEITSDVAHGNLTINPDGTLALVMTQSDFVGSQSFSYDALHADGSTTSHTVNLNVTPGLQDAGWGTGEKHYMLATDADDKVIVEAGETHTKVYVSGSNEALSLADIAQAEGVSISQVTGAFMVERGYGQSEDMALSEDAGMALWNHVTPAYSDTSNWLLLERGYQYDNLGDPVGRQVGGESEMNPLFFGAWGEGSPPEMTTLFDVVYPGANDNIVIQDWHMSGGFFLLDTNNLIVDNVLFTKEEAVVQHSDGVTFRNSEFFDIHREESRDGGEFEAHGDRIQGLFMNHAEGVLIENNLFDQNGWDPDGQDPSMFSHNLYFGATMDDVTLRDNIFMRGASFGAQLRSGGFTEDNVFLDNNAAFASHGGDWENAGPVANYSLITDNLVTSAAHKDAELIGAYSMGIYETGELTALVDNIVAHLADPNNPEEFAEKIWANDPSSTENAVYDDTIVYNWESSHELNGDSKPDENVEGLNQAILDQTTIQNFTAQLLGQPTATIADLADYLRAQANGAFDDVVDADLIIRFFQTGFGVAAEIRDEAATLRFVPDELGDGVRWDNRLNWDTEDLPGLHAGDNVDLGGNNVIFGSSAEVNWLDMGDEGTLNVYGGRLDVLGGFTGNDMGALKIEGAGQVWADGSDATDLGVLVESGRFANTGNMSGTDLAATGGQTILATDGAEFELSSGKSLTIADGDAKVGFDGNDGLAILDMEQGATVAFSSEGNGLGTIREFNSGAYEGDGNLQSGIDLGDARLAIELTGLSAEDGTRFTLMDADEIVGLFDDATVNGLGARDAKIIVDYEADTVVLELSAGSGGVAIETVGAESDIAASNQALWDALTSDLGVASETQQANIPEEDLALDAAL